MIRVVLVETEGEANLGFVVRLCKNFRVDELILVNPKVDPWSEEVRRFAARGVDYLDTGRVKVVKSLDEALEGVGLSACTSAIVGEEGDILRRAIELSEFVDLASRYSSVAIVFGRESVGLRRDEIAKCDVLVYIAANPEYSTLNLSHAVAIVLYELYKKLVGRSLIEEKLGFVDEQSLRIVDKYVEQLVKLVASDERQRECMEYTLKRWIRRVSLTRAEVGFLTTFFRRIAQRLERCA